MTQEKKILIILINKLEAKKNYYIKPIHEQDSRMKFDAIVSMITDNVSVSDYKMYYECESAAKAISAEELVHLKYEEKHNRGNIIRVDLNIGAIDRVYKILNREPLKVVMKSTIDLLKGYFGEEV